MTKSQERTIENIKSRYLEAMHGHTADDYEIKVFETKELYRGKISLVVESGLKGDEGTMASVFCRNRIHIFIGVRGGITYYNNKGTTKRPTRRTSLFSIYYDQKY